MTFSRTQCIAALIFVISVFCKSLFLIYDFVTHERILRYELYNIAKSLAAFGTFADAYGLGSGSTAHAAPVYPFLVSIAIRVFGKDEHVYLAVGILTILCASICYSLLPYLARLFGFPVSAGYVGGFLGAIFPYGRVEISGDFENVFAAAFLFLYSLFAAYHIRRGCSGIKAHILAGVWGGLLALTNTQSLLGFVVVTFISFIRQKKKKFIYPLMTAIVSMLVMLPWLIRNYLVFRHPVFVRSNFWLEASVSNQDGAEPSLERNYKARRFQPLHPYNDEQQLKLYKTLGEVEYMRRQKERFIEWLRRNPGRAARLAIGRILESFYFRHVSSRWFTLAIYTIATASLIGVIDRALKAGINVRLSYFALLMVSFIAVHVLIQTSLRYRFPVHVLQLVGAGYIACRVFWFCLGIGRRVGA